MEMIAHRLDVVLADGGFRAVTEIGRGDGERVLDGTRTTKVYQRGGRLLETKEEAIGSAVPR